MTFIGIIALIFGVEHFIKKHMDKTCLPDGTRPIAGGRVILKKYHNTGAAGNFGGASPNAILCFHAAALGGVLTELLRLFPKKHAGLAKTGLAFLAGGGFSNLHDRLAKGHVVDYFSFGFGPKRFRKIVFNLADLFIFAGSLLVCLAMCITKKKEG